MIHVGRTISRQPLHLLLRHAVKGLSNLGPNRLARRLSGLLYFGILTSVTIPLPCSTTLLPCVKHFVNEGGDGHACFLSHRRQDALLFRCKLYVMSCFHHEPPILTSLVA